MHNWFARQGLVAETHGVFDFPPLSTPLEIDIENDLVNTIAEWNCYISLSAQVSENETIFPCVFELGPRTIVSALCVDTSLAKSEEQILV